MTRYRITKPVRDLKGTIELTASKSESNRVLIIRALCKHPFNIHHLAAAQDTVTLANILKKVKEETTATSLVGADVLGEDLALHNVGPAGTTMRFLTAYFASLEGTRILTGSDRMKQRPIALLVDALRSLGAQIEYLEKEGYPPLKITGTALKGGEVTIAGNVSSQYISALLLIAPVMEKGLQLRLSGEITSMPYITMTLKTMEYFGVNYRWENNTIHVEPQAYQSKDFFVEADWSAASYWYEMAALAEHIDLEIKGLKEYSLQGDSIACWLFSFFGVHTTFEENNTIRLSKRKIPTQQLGFDFGDCPDLAQTIAVTAGALNIPCFFTGLHTLRIKETDRIEAIRAELAKFGIRVQTGPDTIKIIRGEKAEEKITATVATYEDHRMAMAFAPLAYRLKEVIIEEPEVVSKSYPDFWKDLEKVGFKIESC
jgi:3-phosphoshikimate 1-carboxyvinyltransferase